MAILKMGFSPRTSGTIDGTLTTPSSTGSTTPVAMVFNVDETKRKIVKWVNIDLKESRVRGSIYVKRTNPNGTDSLTTKIPLSKFQTTSDFQANKVTIQTDIFLEDGDDLMLDLEITSGSTAVEIGYVADYEIIA